jgi:peptidyl-prolyl cis-trans isomerase A (cyclophilin A)
MTKSLPLIGALLFALAVPEGAAAAADVNPQVLIKTSKGEIVLELYPAKAPATVENFLKYVDDKHYDGTIFHRVIANFMILCIM